MYGIVTTKKLLKKRETIKAKGNEEMVENRAFHRLAACTHKQKHVCECCVKTVFDIFQKSLEDN